MPLKWERANSLIVDHTQVKCSDLLDCDPLVSVCVVTYNHAGYIREALDGIFSQKTDFFFEVVIGDDCSTDGTTDIVLEYLAEYPRQVKVLLADINLGAETGNGRVNFLRTMRACRGQFIALLEGDDYWTDVTKLQLQLNDLQSRSECSVSVHDVNMLFLGTLTRVGYEGDQELFRFRELIEPVMRFHTSSMMFTKQSIQTLPHGFLWYGAADFPLLLSAAIVGDVSRVTKAMSVWRRHCEGYSMTPMHRAIGLHEQRIAMHRDLRRQYPRRADNEFRDVIRKHKILAVKEWSQLPFKQRYALDTLVRILKIIIMPCVV